MTPEELDAIQESIIAKVLSGHLTDKEAKAERKRARWRWRFANDPDFREKHREKTREASKRLRRKQVAENPNYYKKIYWEDAERAKSYSRKWQEVPRNRIGVLVRGRIADARKNGIPFDRLALSELAGQEWTHCLLCHKELNYSFKKGVRPDGPSIDRVVPSLGYVKGNVTVICNGCNVKKGSASADEHRRIAEFIESFSAAAN